MLREMEVSPVLFEMQKSKFVFHLTGSRFFGGYKESSDYDFFAGDEPEIREFLLSLGFHEVSGVLGERGQYYNDNNLALVLYHFVANVHVQLQKSVTLKLGAQRIMFIFRHYWNTEKHTVERRNLWNSVYKVVEDFLG